MSLHFAAAPRAAVVLTALCAVGLGAPAAATTAMAIVPQLEEGPPFVVRYSQAVLFEVYVVTEAGPVAGVDVVVEVDRAEGDDPVFVLATSPTGGAGSTLARLELVNGRHGGETFPARAPEDDLAGERYVLRARIQGDLDPDDPACGGDAGVVDGGSDGLCPAEVELDLFVVPETVSLELQPGNRAALGEAMTLIATLVDPNGSAPVGGTATDGMAGTNAPISDASVSFFFDLDGNERPSADELIARDDTDGNGFATITYTVDPAIFPAGEFPQGLHVQFGGDDRYGLAQASGRVTVDSGPPDPARCVIEVDPEEPLADGRAQATLTGKLVDTANNLLGVDAPDYAVSFTTDLGTVLEDAAVRDPITGFYSQQMRVPAEAGDATITIVVDGTPGATRTVTFVSNGCRCVDGSSSRPLLASISLALLAAVVGRRRAPRPKSPGRAP